MSETLRALRKPRMFVVFIMGFYSGLPFLLIGGTLKAWLKLDGIDLKTIGAFALVGLPYTWKFIWAPIVDRYAFFNLGRRRTWLFIAQIGLIASMLWMSVLHPHEQIGLVIAAAVMISFWSATQDIAVDAYRREILPDEDLGLGSSLTSLGYRFGLLLAGAGVLSIAQESSWQFAYEAMAAVMVTGLFVTFFIREPELVASAPHTFRESVVGPLKDFFARKGAWIILAFVLLYKIGESMASDMLNPFYIDMHFSLNEIAGMAKVFGLWSAMVGGIVGGVLIIRLKLYRSLWIFGVLQSLGLLLFSVLSQVGHSLPMLGIAIIAENFTSGMASSAYGAFMAAQTNRRFTGTQYALLTSIMSVPARVFGATTGVLASNLGWFWYFIACAAFTVPGLMLIFAVRNMIEEQGL